MADQTNIPARDPASLEEAVPEAERGQGARQQEPQRAIDEAAADGVDLNSDRDEPRTTVDETAASRAS